MFIDFTMIDLTKLWSQEFMGFLAVIATLITFSYQMKKNTESGNTKNKLSKVELWLKYQEEMNTLINLIDDQWNELVKFDEDVKKICLTSVENLKGKTKDQIINHTNNIIRLHLRLFSMKKQFHSLYSQIDPELNIIEPLKQTWMSDVEPYFYFYFDEEKRPLFMSAYKKSKKLENFPKDFCEYVELVESENKKFYLNQSHTVVSLPKKTGS